MADFGKIFQKPLAQGCQMLNMLSLKWHTHHACIHTKACCFSFNALSLRKRSLLGHFGSAQKNTLIGKIQNGWNRKRSAIKMLTLDLKKKVFVSCNPIIPTDPGKGENRIFWKIHKENITTLLFFANWIFPPILQIKTCVLPILSFLGILQETNTFFKA